MTMTADRGLDRAALLDRFRRVRARTRALFGLLDETAYYERPIALRNPIVFYEGHLPGFAVNTLIRKALGRRGMDAHLEAIFARGIDPETEAAAVARGNPAWPDRAAVQAYAVAADALIEDAILTADLDRPGDPLLDRGQALWVILEHEEMHQETLAYMWHQLPYAMKHKPEGYHTEGATRLAGGATRPFDGAIAGSGGATEISEGARSEGATQIVAGAAPTLIVSGGRVEIPPGIVQLGTPDHVPFAWDNERPAHDVHVDAFTIDVDNVTNAGFLAFVEAGGYQDPRWWRDADFAWILGERRVHPPFWERVGDAWYWRGMFERVPLPLSWPVYVTWAEARAYAAWRRGRLMTEAEFQRASEQSGTGNVDFHRWDPEPVGARAESVSVHGVRDLFGNGWEWTATPFAPFDGFQPIPSYPEYSADFFDDDHFVMKGASPVTARELIRAGFRNWFRPRYPYVYATFRVVGGV